MVAIKSETKGANQAELLIRCCTEIVRELLEAHHDSRSINLNALKTKVAKKYKCNVVARLVDIIAAVPQEARDILLPKLRAKPVRTASGVSEIWTNLNAKVADGWISRVDRYCCRHVETASLSSYRHDRKHLRVRSLLANSISRD